MKTITKKWLKKYDACIEGVKWWETLSDKTIKGIYKQGIKEKRFSDINWMLTRLFNRKQCIQYAVYAAEQVFYIFEKENPQDKRPRNAIDAAIKCIDNDTKKNRDAAWAARDADRAAGAVAWAARAAAGAARDASWAASAAGDAGEAAWAARDADRDAVYKKILNYGMKLYHKDTDNG